MTKEQIIEELKKSAKPYEEYYLDDEILSAMLSYQNPYEFVEPILEIISTNPSVNFGMPGDLVHFVEKFYKKGYEELLINSVRKNPTSHNILMLHRCYNDIKNPNRNEFAKVVKTLKNDKSVSSEIKNIIDGIHIKRITLLSIYVDMTFMYMTMSWQKLLNNYLTVTVKMYLCTIS